MDRQIFDNAYYERLRAGDTETERHFVAHFSSLILMKTTSRPWLVPFAEDVRQETLVRALDAIRSKTTIRSPEKLGAFVNSICNNVMMEVVRTDKRHHRVPAEHKNSVENSPEESFITEERKAMVRQVIGALGKRDKTLLQSLFLEEREKDEVCEKFSVDRDYLRVLLHRAKTQFRSLYLKTTVAVDAGCPSPTRGRWPHQVK